jgi:hypothetical protein
MQHLLDPKGEILPAENRIPCPLKKRNQLIGGKIWRKGGHQPVPP